MGEGPLRPGRLNVAQRHILRARLIWIWPSPRVRFAYNGRARSNDTCQKGLRTWISILSRSSRCSAWLPCCWPVAWNESSRSSPSLKEKARVSLNDEQIGESPVTVTFNWYGDYYVRATKEGYETLQTHRELDAPWYDWFPLDFFAQVLYPGHIVDSQEWTFELAPSQPPTRDELLQEADALRQQVQ